MLTSTTLAMMMKKLTVVWVVITASLVAQEVIRPAPTVPVSVLDPVVITLIGGMIVTVISAIVTGIVTVITALRQGENSRKIDGVAKDTEAIKGHVNSEKTASEGRESALRQEIVTLREMVADHKTAAALLAQAASSRMRELSAEPAISQRSLLNIDANTAAIEKNTARTVETVQDLKKEQ